MPPLPRTRILILATLDDAVLAGLQTSSFGPFEPILAESAPNDAEAVIVDASRAEPFLSRSAMAATLVVADDPTPEAVVDWLRMGAQDVIVPPRTKPADWPLRVRIAIERRRRVDEVRRSLGIDLDTGLPDQHQLVEHMSHLMALRAREPAPMALLVLRIEGLATTQSRLGREAAQVLRRKLAVRLRAGVRASDVVASLGDDRFAVLLVAMLASADAQHVADKLLASLAAPLQVAGQSVAVSVALGIGQHPADGDRPEQLFARASALAAAATAQGRSGFANFDESGGIDAANDS
jgi:diguanylate cyclase (GGDEF)-like protein